MNQYLIKMYLNKLTTEDIRLFAQKEGVHLSNEESTYLLQTIRMHYQELLYGDPTPIFNEAKKHLSENHVQIALKLYHYYKEKYQSFL